MNKYKKFNKVKNKKVKINKSLRQIKVKVLLVMNLDMSDFRRKKKIYHNFIVKII